MRDHLRFEGVHTKTAAPKNCDCNNARLARTCHYNLIECIRGTAARGQYTGNAADIFVVHSDALEYAACGAVDDANTAC
jgi:hypothetical protein